MEELLILIKDSKDQKKAIEEAIKVVLYYLTQHESCQSQVADLQGELTETI